MMLIDEVLDARMVVDGTSAARFLKMACLSGKDSETAYFTGIQRV